MTNPAARCRVPAVVLSVWTADARATSVSPSVEPAGGSGTGVAPRPAGRRRCPVAEFPAGADPRPLARPARPPRSSWPARPGWACCSCSCVALLAADLVTGFGWLACRVPARATGGGARRRRVLGVFGTRAGVRAPVVREHDVEVAICGRNSTGFASCSCPTCTSARSSATLGRGAGSRRWTALRPDLVVVTGDLLGAGRGAVRAPLVPTLAAAARAPGRLGRHRQPRVLRGPRPLAGGVPGCGHRRAARPGRGGRPRTGSRRRGRPDGAPPVRLSTTSRWTAMLANRPPGTTIFLCHSPWEVERAAELGADLMLSGHTHDGQIWPFTYLVRLMYPYGRPDVTT